MLLLLDVIEFQLRSGKGAWTETVTTSKDLTMNDLPLLPTTWERNLDKATVLDTQIADSETTCFTEEEPGSLKRSDI